MDYHSFALFFQLLLAYLQISKDFTSFHFPEEDLSTGFQITHG